MTERVQSRRVADLTGLTIRTVQLMAERGAIPSAAKLGSRWTFEEVTVRDWIRREAGRCRRTSIVEERRGMPACELAGMSIEKAYEQLLSRPRGRV